MARIVIISLYDEFAPGMRTLVATLKNAGHFCAMICFKSYSQTPIEQVDHFYEGMHVEVLPSGDHVNSYSYPPTAKEDEILLNLVKKMEPDLVGVGLTYSQQVAARRITGIIKQETSLPVIWGGPHPTTAPEQCIKYADYVCRGEAEDVLLDVAARIDLGKSFSDIANIWAKNTDGSILKNKERPLRLDLDSLPFPDYSRESIFFIDDDQLRCGIPFEKSDLNTNYIVLTARGCPFACSYCYQSYLKTLYPKQKFVRERSLENVMEELKLAKKRMGHFYLEILDNIFTLKEKRVAEFCKRYHEEINEPFWCYTHPRCSGEKVIRPLAECPNFEYIIMGIESVSNKIGKEMFNREQSPDMILKAARTMNKHGINVNFDMITGIPGETEGDCRENLNLLRALPKPFRIRLSKLSLFPNYRVDKESQGQKRLVTEKRYRIWNALYFLTQDIDLSDEEIEAILSNPFFENHPEVLENINTVFDQKWEELSSLRVQHYMKSVELECMKEQLQKLQSELNQIKGRKGFRHFLWLHERAVRAKKRLKGLF